MSDVTRTGRPTLYRQEYDEQARKLCLLGATDKDLAEFFGVTEQTINNWKLAHSRFFESVNEGKEHADARVAESLYHRALGYSHDAVKILQYEGSPVIVPYTERYPPDTAAAIFWLKNRQRDRWRDRQDIAVSADGSLAELIEEARQRTRPEKLIQSENDD